MAGAGSGLEHGVLTRASKLVSASVKSLRQMACGFPFQVWDLPPGLPTAVPLLWQAPPSQQAGGRCLKYAAEFVLLRHRISMIDAHTTSGTVEAPLEPAVAVQSPEVAVVVRS